MELSMLCGLQIYFIIVDQKTKKGLEYHSDDQEEIDHRIKFDKSYQIKSYTNKNYGRFNKET